MKNAYLTNLIACLVSLALIFPISDGLAENPIKMMRVKPTSVSRAAPAAVGRSLIGGVRICLPADLPDARVHQVSISDKSIDATLDGGAAFSVPNDPTVLNSLVAVVAQDHDHCIEVSIDPIARYTYNYYASDGLDGSTLANRLLALDEELGSLYRGRHPLSKEQLGPARLPQEQARHLLSSEHGSKEYRQLALRYALPPGTAQMTTMRLDSVDGSSITWDVHLSPSFSSPDGQKLYASGSEKSAATMPYLPLIQRFETAPDKFFDNLPHLKHGLNIARTYSLISACQQNRTPSCQRLFEHVAGHPAPAENAPAHAFEGFWAWSRAKDNHLTKVWQEYRDQIDYSKLNRDQRVAFAADESLARYRDLLAAQAQSKRTGITPQAILEMTADVDLTGARYGGWGHLSRFLGMVWVGAPFADTMDALDQAYRQAQASDDHTLRYQVMRSVRELLTVIASNAYIAERTETSPGLSTVTFDPAGKLRPGVRMGPRGYLRYLDKTIDDAIGRHVKAEFQRLLTEVQRSLREDVRKLKVKETQSLLYEFGRSHIVDERALLEKKDVLELLASLHCSIGLAAVNEGDISLARNHLRMLHSIDAVNKKEKKPNESIERLVAKLKQELGTN